MTGQRSFLFLCFVVCGGLSADEGANDLALARSIFAGEPLAVAAVVTERGDEQYRSAWRGDRPRMNGEITTVEVELTFAELPPPITLPGVRQLSPVTLPITVSFDRESVTVRHAAPMDDTLRGGVRTSFQPRQPSVIYLRGRGNTSLVVGFGKRTPGSGDAVVLCPRIEYGRRLVRRFRPLASRPAIIQGVRFDARGALSSKLLSGRGDGTLIGEFVVAPNLPPPLNAREEITARDPELSMTYESSVPSTRQAATETSLEVRLTSRNSAGHSRVASVVGKAVVAEVNLTEEVEVPALGVLVEPGTCFLVKRRTTIDTVYSGPPENPLLTPTPELQEEYADLS